MEMPGQGRPNGTPQSAQNTLQQTAINPDPIARTPRRLSSLPLSPRGQRRLGIAGQQRASRVSTDPAAEESSDGSDPVRRRSRRLAGVVLPNLALGSAGR